MKRPKAKIYLTGHQVELLKHLFDLAEELDKLGTPGALMAQVGYFGGIPMAHVAFIEGDEVEAINIILNKTAKEKANEVQTIKKTGA